jgi:hypothetical protein
LSCIATRIPISFDKTINNSNEEIGMQSKYFARTNKGVNKLLDKDLLAFFGLF